MSTTLIFLAVSCVLVQGNPLPVKQARNFARDGQVAYNDPRNGGGSMLDKSAGLGEPLNAIISGLSSPEVLSDDGFMKYANAIGFAQECFGLHLGDPQTANLGDGNGDVNEIKVIRQAYGPADDVFGACKESLVGGNHFRYWRQAGTGALFLATSKEEDASEHHNIVPHGYDIGRDELVAAAQGDKTFQGQTYSTQIEDVDGLLPLGSEGINHDIAIDGVVKLLTVSLK